MYNFPTRRAFCAILPFKLIKFDLTLVVSSIAHLPFKLIKFDLTLVVSSIAHLIFRGLMSAWRKVRFPYMANITLLHSSLTTFRFPDEEKLYLTCDIQV